MASPTRRLKVRRKLAQVGAGKSRKNRIRRQGSTEANLPLNVPNANETAQAKKA